MAWKLANVPESKVSRKQKKTKKKRTPPTQEDAAIDSLPETGGIDHLSDIGNRLLGGGGHFSVFMEHDVPGQAAAWTGRLIEIGGRINRLIIASIAALSPTGGRDPPMVDATPATLP